MNDEYVQDVVWRDILPVYFRIYAVAFLISIKNYRSENQFG